MSDTTPTRPGWYWWLADHAEDPSQDAYPVWVTSCLIAWLSDADGGPTPVAETPGGWLGFIPYPDGAE